MNSVAVNLLAHAVTGKYKFMLPEAYIYSSPAFFGFSLTLGVLADINVAQCVPEERHSYRLVLRWFIFVAGSNIFETAGNVDEMA